MKRSCRNLLSTVIVTFFYPKLSILHLASYSYWKKEEQKKKELKVMKKKIKRILNKSANANKAVNYNDYKQVFFELYHRMDSLSIKELKILRDFCKLTQNNLNRVECSLEKNKAKIDIYNRYHEEIEDTIDNQKQHQKSIWRRNQHNFSKNKR